MVEEKTARGVWTATAKWKAGESLYPIALAKFEVEFRREPGAWRISKVYVGRP